VTYREVDLLIDDATASSRQLQRVAEVVIHELAHQWFGNLVTMEWWDDLWLNEGFATWMETGVCARLYPEWSMWEQFITDMQGRALKLDALRSSHPIQVPIAKAEEVEQVFDAISYCKGGSVVRMVHAVVGEECFTRGLRNYMTAFKFGNATTDDLWSAWEVRRHLHHLHLHSHHLHHHHHRLHRRRRAASRSRR
jgi:puromycin-sensitive aminopeptidase